MDRFLGLTTQPQNQIMGHLGGLPDIGGGHLVDDVR